jgi:hypothetical protein
LSVWRDPNENSRHYDTTITRRFAHTITSWPSHDLQTTVDCRRCHHPQGQILPAVAATVGCDNLACHPNGAVLNWCPALGRNPAPEAALQP